MNRSVAGKVYPEVPFTVDAQRVEAFRGVFEEPTGVPVTFPTAAEFSVMPQIVADPELGLDFARVLHGSQEYAFRRALEEGETLTIRARIEAIRELGGNGFVTIVTDLVGSDGAVACTGRSTMIERGGD
jgi:N-terminal half of MaoC dehydratase